MRKLLSLAVLPVLSGCLTAASPETKDWIVECDREAIQTEKAKFGAVRVSQVVVRSPYDVRGFNVLRSDDTVALDAYNRFVSIPSQMLKGPVVDAFVASGRFKSVVWSTSAASVDLSAEVEIRRIAIDCRENDRKTATVSLGVRLIDRSRNIVTDVRGEDSVPISSGDYTKAFSDAFNGAIEAALKRL